MSEPYAEDARVSLGDGCYILGKDANRLIAMANEPDTRQDITLKGMSDYQRAAVLAIIPSPFRLNLGEMTHDERTAHLTATSDYNIANQVSPDEE